ncbi:hypothetical protein [Streptomyces sp. NPDC086010]|uniref:hypothetical protein n=1 Tax=Streptomyces sp. NPDC086010 TaxID=3365745 RepID=UPI0037CCEA60
MARSGLPGRRGAGVICPHCAASLTGKERAGRVCGPCGRRFALDPAVDGRGAHDLRIRRIVEHATGHGRIRITLHQLWYLSLSHHEAWPPRPAHGVPPRLRRLVAWPVAAVLLGCAVLGAARGSALLAWAAAGAAALVLVVASSMRHRPARRAGFAAVPDGTTFYRRMADGWTDVYGGLPDGVVDDEYPLPDPSVPSGRPEAVILCTDASVGAFLRINGIPARLGAVVIAPGEDDGAREAGFVADALKELAGYRGTLPVVVVHDAEPLGVLLAPLVRAAHPGRTVVDAGLPVAVARTRPGAVVLAPHGSAVRAPELRAVAGLSESDAAWLAEGFWSPLAAVPPKLLESVVVRAVEHARSAGPAGTGDADTGFLAWPAEQWRADTSVAPGAARSDGGTPDTGRGRTGPGTSRRKGGGAP